ncbi:PREDICTED: uncharacterized protein LOC109223538 [Nicotiana attenuata]|uniref:uncharacterized protein LOC109223538 n=1 Tax=Nicotiana attenuata TaxID=49451 RepID=UPI000904BA8A|nr:PREDICTED: uncharacterized protein LOC109223538 [Nicotiana attenuata]
MDRVCIYIAYNGKWTTDNKYLYHEIKLILVNDGITFEDLVEKIFQVLKLKRGEVQPTIWFDTNLETSKGMLVTNDEEVTTCIYLLKNDPNFKTSRFIVDMAERNSLSARYSKTEEVNIVQHEEMQIDRDEALIPVEPITEFESLAKDKSVDTEQSTHGMKLRKRSLPRKVIKKRKRSRSKRNDWPTVVLGGNASLDEIAVGSLFENKESLKKCFTNSAIKYHFKFKTVRSTKKRYYLKCYDDNCSWYLHASRVRDSALFKISKYVEDHSCSADVLQPDQQRHATSRVISGYIRELLPEYETEMTPNFVKEEMRKRFGLNISYHKAWRSIQLAFDVTKGSPEQNNELLPSESEQNNEFLVSEPYKELLPSEPEQNNELLMSEPEQKNDLLPSEPEQNNDLLMSEPERNNELLPSEPEQNDFLMSEPERNNELLPSEPEQNSELLMSEPEQKIELLVSIPEQNNELPSEPEQNNELLPSEPLRNNELLPSEALQHELIPSEERNPGRDDQAVLV